MTKKEQNQQDLHNKYLPVFIIIAFLAGAAFMGVLMSVQGKSMIGKAYGIPYKYSNKEVQVTKKAPLSTDACFDAQYGYDELQAMGCFGN